MNTPLPEVFEIIPSIKNYAWGLQNKDCWVGKFLKKISTTQDPLAEAWFGAHPNGPAIALIAKQEISLAKLIEDRSEELLSKKDQNSFSGALPVLPKILSISQPLSIQLHPNEKEAQRLHAKDSSRYPDPYPKDEASIALTKVSLLHSLLSFKTITSNAGNNPELKTIIKNASSSLEAFENLLLTEDEKIETLSKKLFERLSEKKVLSDCEKWILECKKIYSKGDRGIFCFLLFHIIDLEPGEAISLTTGTPHAYLSGELLEVMKPSDNVLRCGLTPKHVDSKELMNCLDKNQIKPTVIQVQKTDDGSLLYDFGKQGFSVKIIEKNCLLQTGGDITIAISLNAKGAFTGIMPIESYKAYCIPTRDSALDISIQSGQLALFSYQG